MIAGARVEVAPYKKSAMDFVLWKPSDAAHAGLGFALGPRPSRLAHRMLGHGGPISGRDLRHSWRRHRSDVSASRERDRPERRRPSRSSAGARSGCTTASCRWKARRCPSRLGNFFTIRDLLADWPGEVLRFNMLRTHYRQPIDFTVAGLRESWKTLERWYEVTEPLADPGPDAAFLAALRDDLNTPAAIASLHQAGPQSAGGRAGLPGLLQCADEDLRQGKGRRSRHRRCH